MQTRELRTHERHPDFQTTFTLNKKVLQPSIPCGILWNYKKPPPFSYKAFRDTGCYSQWRSGPYFNIQHKTFLITAVRLACCNQIGPVNSVVVSHTKSDHSRQEVTGDHYLSIFPFPGGVAREEKLLRAKQTKGCGSSATEGQGY